MALTAHYDASDTGQLFTTFVSSGVHTGTPSNGGTVEVWDDEAADDQAFMFEGAGQAPTYRSPASALMRPGLLSELDFNGTSHRLVLYDQVGASAHLASSMLTTSGHVVMVALYPEAITSTATNPWDREAVIATVNDNWGIYLWNDGGTRRVSFYFTDGADHLVTATIVLNVPSLIVAMHTGIYLQITVTTPSTYVESPTETCGTNSGLATALCLGQSTHEYFNGRIGELKIWNTGDADGDITGEYTTLLNKWITAEAAGGFPIHRWFGGVPHLGQGRNFGRSW